MKTKINITDFQDNVVKLISQEWMLISAGGEEKFNTMTASWGGMGYLWNKPVVFVFVRPERYTYEFMEREELFSLSFFTSDYKKALSLLGSKSGRDCDKVAEAGLTPTFTEAGTPAFEEARVTIECRKLYSEIMKEEAFIEKSFLEKYYTQMGGLHQMYVAEIVNVWM